MLKLTIPYGQFAAGISCLMALIVVPLSAEVILDPFLVSGERDQSDNYKGDAAFSSASLKMDASLLETPQAVSIIPVEQALEQGNRKLEQILRNASGVTTGGSDLAWDYYRIRGFDASTSVHVDGLIGPNGTTEELWGMERIEVVKGPSASLYGQGPAGGFVNLVSKRPHPGLAGEIMMSGGSWNFFESAFDINAPLAASSGLFFRINGLYRHENSFVDYAGTERLYAAPSFLWQAGPNTTVSLLLSYKEDWIDYANGLPALGTVWPTSYGNLPPSRYAGDPAHPNELHARDAWAGLEIEHRFSDSIRFRQSLRLTDFKQDWHLLLPDELLDDERTLVFLPYKEYGSGNILQVDTALEFDFPTGPAAHRVLAGFDYLRYDETYVQYWGLNAPELDLFSPDYGAMEAPVFDGASRASFVDESLGLYLQDMARIGEKLTVVLGGRADFLENDDGSEHSFSPRAGAVWEFFPGMAAYVNYSRSFGLQSGQYTQAGEPLPPEKGECRELGLKMISNEIPFTAQMAVFEIKRRDLAVGDPDTADPFDYIAAGEQRSRGVELEVEARVWRGLRLLAAYTFTEAEITRDSELPVGATLPGAPRHACRLWLVQTLQEGRFKGLGAGFGVTYYSSQYVDYNNSVELPAFTLLDAALYYQRKNFRLQVNFGNITDRRYYTGGSDELNLYRGDPFNIRAAASWLF